MKIVALAFEKGMLFDMQDNVEVAGRSAEDASFAESGKANASAVFDSGGNFCFNGALTHQPSLALALRTGIGNDTARTLASGASAGDAEESLLIAHLAAAIAGTALDRRFTRSGAGSVTRVASLMAANFDVLFSTEERFIEFQVKVFAQIGAALGASAPAASTAEQIAETKEFSEDVAEVLKNCGIEAGGTARVAHTRVSEAVVKGALLGVGENCVGLGQLFEFIFRIGIIGVAVGMVGHRQLAVGALDLNFGGRAGDTEHLVVVAFAVVGQKSKESFAR